MTTVRPPDAPAYHDLDQPRVLTEDSRAAAAVLTSGDPDVVQPGKGLLLGITRRWATWAGAVRVRLLGGQTRLRDVGARWPVVGVVVARYRRLMDEAYRQQAALAAAGAALWLIISIFPAMIAAVNVFGLFVDPAQVVTSLHGMTDTISGGFGRDVTRQLEQVAAANTRTLSIGLIVSVALSLWSMSAGLAAITKAIRQAYGLRPLTFLEVRRRSYVAAMFVVVMLGVGVGFAAIEAALVDLANRVWIGWAAAVFDLPVAILFVAFMVTALYRLAIGKRIKWRPLVPGVLFATVGLIVIGAGYSLFLDFFTERYSAVYGAVAGTVLALLLAYFAVYLIVLGAIVNAQHLADQRAAQEAATEPADGAVPTPLPEQATPGTAADQGTATPVRPTG